MSYFYGPSALPNSIGLIPPGTGGPILITSFDPAAGLWNYVYPDAATGITLVLNANKNLVITSPGPRDSTAKQYFAGVRSRFKLWPDSTGLLKYRIKFSTFSYAGLVAASVAGFGGLWFTIGGTSYNNPSNFYSGAVGATSIINTVSSIGNFTTSSFVDSITNLGVTNYGAVAADLNIRITVAWDPAATGRYKMNLYEYEFPAGNWNVAALGGTYNVGYSVITGHMIALGYVGKTLEVMQSTLSEFELINGIASL